MSIFRSTEHGRSMFWEAYPSLNSQEVFTNLPQLYPHALHLVRGTMHYGDHVGSTPSHLIVSPQFDHRAIDLPQDVIITPHLQLWIATNPDIGLEGQECFPKIHLPDWDYETIFTNWAYWTIYSNPEIQQSVRLNSRGFEDPLHCILWPVHDHTQLKRLLQLLG